MTLPTEGAQGESNGWTLLFHPLIRGQIAKLDTAAEKALAAGRVNANVKLRAALAKQIYARIPADPAAKMFQQGNTLGAAHRHWRRAKFADRFRLYFRYDARAKIIAYAWVNDAHHLRKAGAKTDPYAVFKGMLKDGDPPTSMADLIRACTEGRGAP